MEGTSDQEADKESDRGETNDVTARNQDNSAQRHVRTRHTPRKNDACTTDIRIARTGLSLLGR